MKKFFSLFVFAALLVSTSAFAVPNRVGKSEIGINVSALEPSLDDADTSVFIGGNYAYGVNEWLAIGVESGWAESDVDPDDTVSVVPLLADIIFRVPMTAEQPIAPYGVVGLGVNFWDYSVGSGTIAALNSALASIGSATRVTSLTVDPDPTFAAKIGGGFDWFINEHWAVNFEASYTISDFEGDTSVSSTGGAFPISIDEDGDYWMVGGGLKYQF